MNFRDWGNTEIMTEWYVLGIENGYNDLRPSIEKFLMKIGRRKYLMPIYKALAKKKEDKEWAKTIFSKARSNYHYVSCKTIEEILGVKGKS
jgi:leukotriene-A4 hydrolase